MAAFGVKVWIRASNVLKHDAITEPMMIEGLMGSYQPFFPPELHQFYGATRITMLHKSNLKPVLKAILEIVQFSSELCRVQDPYSLRCMRTGSWSFPKCVASSKKKN